jgi:hypothetical protein
MSALNQSSDQALSTDVWSLANVIPEGRCVVAQLDLPNRIVAQPVFPVASNSASGKTSKLKKSWVDFMRQVIGEPNYSFTLTLRPAKGQRHIQTKINDSKKAMSWFINVLNTKCFGQGYRRKKIELGFFATLEGLGVCDQPHWHGAIRLPKRLSNEKFLLAFEFARKKTKRFGRQFDLTPYYESGWFEYTIKTGTESVHTEFLISGTP